MPAPVELFADCPECGLESGVVETYDPLIAACRFGVPSLSRCRLCGVTCEARLDREAVRMLREVPANRCPVCIGELHPSALDDRRCAACGVNVTLTVKQPSKIPSTEEELGFVLDAWAARENFRSRAELLQATFTDPSMSTILRRLASHEPIEVVADPFANMGMRPSGSAKAKAPKSNPDPPRSPRAIVHDPMPGAVSSRPFDGKRTDPDPLMELKLGTTDPDLVLVLPTRVEEEPPPSAPPRAVVYPLVSVIAADGEIHPQERELLDRFLQSEGLPPLTEQEFQVHHPSTVAHFIPKERREALVQLMCETAAVDGMPDESERKVIRAYAAAWDIPDEKVDFWMWGYENMGTSFARQLWLKIRRFVLSARWSEEQAKDPT